MKTKVDDFVEELGEGEAFFAPMPVRIGPRHLREPDIAFIKAARLTNPQRRRWG